MPRPPRAPPARRAAFALHVGQPVKRARGLGSGRERHGVDTTPPHGSAGTGRGAVPLACGSWQIGRFARFLALRRTPHRARNRVDAISHDPSYRRAKFCRERQRGRRSPLLPGRWAASIQPSCGAVRRRTP